MVTLLFIGGVQIIYLGILGEYLDASLTRLNHVHCTSWKRRWNASLASRRVCSTSTTTNRSSANRTSLGTLARDYYGEIA